MKKLLPVVVLLFGCFSCCDDSDPEINVDALSGFWNLHEVKINGKSSAEYNFSPANFLKLDSDNTFSRAYISGNWVLSGRKLTLQHAGSIQMPDWSYEILSISEDRLVIEMQLIEAEYLWNFDSFAENDVLNIREAYVKLK